MYGKKRVYPLFTLFTVLIVSILLAFLPHSAQAASPDTPDVTSIENNSSGITVEWSEVSGATSYDIYRWENGVGGNSIYITVNSSVTSYTDTNVSIGKTYIYYIRAYNQQTGTTSEEGRGGWMERLLAPATVETSKSGNSATIRWTESQSAEYYKIEVSKNETFSSPLSYWTTDTTRKLAGLVSGQTYYVRIRAYDEVKSDYSAWSPTVEFTISKKSSAKSSKTLKYSDSKTSLQKMWTAGPSASCIEFFNLVKENKNGSSMSFLSIKSYKEAVRYYSMITGDKKVISRNTLNVDLTFRIRENPDNKAYTTGTKGCLKYYKKAYKMLSKAGVKSGMSAYKAALKIEAYIRKITKYDKTQLKNYNFYSIIDRRKGVCQAYTQLFQVMCIQAGIDCRYCSGTYKGGAHAWNKFKADGKWHYIDVTFRDTDGTKSWPVSKKKLANHKATKTLKFADAYTRYNIGVSYLR